MKRNIAKTTFFLVVVGVALVALPAVGLTGPCLSGGQIGACPGWVDVKGTGVFDPADPLITFGFSVGAAQLTIMNPWSTACGEPGGQVIQFGSPTGCGFTTASTTVNPFAGPQAITATGFTGGLPNAFSFAGGASSGNGSLTPAGGPPYSMMALTGGIMTTVGPFQGVDASGGGGPLNHITIPWAQASMLGMNGACGNLAFPGGDPQIFLPVVPGTAPGTGQLVPSFPGMCSSPMLLMAVFEGRATIPTLSEWGLIVLLVGLGLAGWELLRRSGALA
ncbi:MAG: IPTL-CTERM sorting domain-containing protein [Thermoanaerobaculales bacterium]